MGRQRSLPSPTCRPKILSELGTTGFDGDVTRSRIKVVPGLDDDDDEEDDDPNGSAGIDPGPEAK